MPLSSGEAKLSTYKLLCAHLLMAAALFSLHHSVAFAINHGAYTPFVATPQFSSLTWDETFAYAPQARKFMALGRLAPESDNYEQKQLHGAMPFLSEAILGAMGRALGSLEAAFIVADALFPAALLALLFALTEDIVSGFAPRILIAWTTLLVGFAPRSFLGLGLDGPRGLLEITRTPNPEISVLVFLLAIYCVARALQPRAGWPSLAAAIIVSAMNFYTYYFYTVAWAITLTLLLGIMLFSRNRRLVTRTALITAGTALLATPFAAAIWMGNAEGGQVNLLAQFGGPAREPDWLALIPAIFGLSLLLLRGRSLFRPDSAPLKLGLLCLAVLAGLLGMNVQLVTGLRFEEYHFLYRLIEPLGLFLAGCLGIHHLKRVTVPALVILLVFAATRQTLAGIAIADSQRSDTPDIELLTWARSHLSPDAVIGACDPQLVLLIPAITPEFTYIPSHLRSLTSPAETAARSHELSDLLGCSPQRPNENAVVITRRLNYVVLNASQNDLPQNLKQQFPAARQIYSNRKYRLIATALSEPRP